MFVEALVAFCQKALCLISVSGNVARCRMMFKFGHSTPDDYEDEACGFCRLRVLREDVRIPVACSSECV